MKNKIIVICTVFTILLFSFWIYSRENDLYKDRYHEHLEKNISVTDYDYSNINESTFQSMKISTSTFSSHLPVITFDTRGQ